MFLRGSLVVILFILSLVAGCESGRKLTAGGVAPTGEEEEKKGSDGSVDTGDQNQGNNGEGKKDDPNEKNNTVTNRPSEESEDLSEYALWCKQALSEQSIRSACYVGRKDNNRTKVSPEIIQDEIKADLVEYKWNVESPYLDYITVEVEEPEDKSTADIVYVFTAEDISRAAADVAKYEVKMEIIVDGKAEELTAPYSEAVSEEDKADTEILGVWRNNECFEIGNNLYRTWDLTYRPNGETEFRESLYDDADCTNASQTPAEPPAVDSFTIGKKLGEGFEMDITREDGAKSYSVIKIDGDSLFVADVCDEREFSEGFCPEVNGRTPEERVTDFSRGFNFSKTSNTDKR